MIKALLAKVKNSFLEETRARVTNVVSPGTRSPAGLF